MNQKHSKEYKSIGQTIKKYRKLRGLTQEQLADMVCISISYLTKIEAPNCDLQIAIQNGHLCHVRRSVCDIIGGQPKTN